MSAELAGTGIGVVSVPRFERALGRFGARMLGRLFLPGEIAYADARRTGAQSLAVRLAAKLAGRSALAGMGLRRIPPRDLEVTRERGQAPTLRILGDTAERLAAERLRFTASLTHDPELALATVWVERLGRRASLSPP